MSFPNVETHSFKVSRGYNYTYWFSKAKDGNPTILFLHGYPESKYCYRKQVAYFSEIGWGVICPDLLGYDETDKPMDLDAYIAVRQCKDLTEIMDHESVSKAFIVGHDWGCLPASRIINVYPERCLGLCLVALGYLPPGQPWDIEKVLEASEKHLGYQTLGYFPFFGAPTKDGQPTLAAKLISENIDSFVAAVFPADFEVPKTALCRLGSMEAWLKADRRVPLNPKFTDEEIAHYRKIMQRDANTNLNWYRASMAGIHHPHEQDLSPKTDLPVLYMAADNDVVCVWSVYVPSMKEAMSDLEVQHFQTSHWLVSEEPDKANKSLQDFIQRKVLKQARL